MNNKTLYVFIFKDNKTLPFPLFWSEKQLDKVNYKDLDEDLQDKIDYIFSDVSPEIKPEDGFIIGWSHLNLLEDESILFKLQIPV